MARQGLRAWGRACTLLLYASGGVGLGCAEATGSSAPDAGLASAPNLNQSPFLDGGENALASSSLDAASLGSVSSDTKANESSEGLAQTGANFGLPGFGGGRWDAGTPVFGPTSTNAEPDPTAPSHSASSSSLDAGEMLGTSAADPSTGGAFGCAPCPTSDDPCSTYVCNTLLGACEPTPNVGAECDDGNACTTADRCNDSGQCTGASVECKPSGNACVVNECNPQSGSCEPYALPPTTTCDDGNPCTSEDKCSGSGECRGQDTDCSDLNGQCLTGTCNTDSGECEALPARVNETCVDDDPCTLDDVCNDRGVCGGVEKDCTEHSDTCRRGVCNRQSGECQPENLPDGSACNDLSNCTTNDACTSGVCAGIRPDTCTSGGNVELIGDSTFITVDTSCIGVGNDFDVASLIPTESRPAEAGDCDQSLGRDVFLLLDLSEHAGAVRIQASTDHPTTLFDTVLILMGADAASERQCGYTTLAACSDDVSGDKAQSSIDVTVPAGTYALVVDGYIEPKKGVVGLSVTVTPQ